MPFAIKKGRFKLSTPAKCTSHVKLSKGGQSTNIKVNTKFKIAITGTIVENPSFYSDIRRFGWSSYTSLVVINVCCVV